MRPRELAAGGYIETRGIGVRIAYRMSALRLAAWVILVTVAFGVVCIRGGHDLRGQKAAAESVFFEGANGDGLGIRRDLDTRLEVTYNLMTVAKRYLPADDANIRAVDAARERLQMSKNMNGLYEDSISLGENADALIQKLEGMAVSEQDVRYLRGFAADLRSTEITMAQDSYNASAAAYNELLTGFPGGVIAFFNMAECAEYFGPVE